MATIAALTLNDGQATPVSHTFSPVRVDAAGVAKWTDRSSGISLGFPVITLGLREPTKGSRNFKVTSKIVVPILEQTSASTASGIQPAPTLSYALQADLTVILPERSTLANRKDLEAYLKNFIASAVMSTALLNFENAY